MAKLYDLQEIIDETGLPERTVRYYLAEVLDAPGGTPGRKSYYPQITVDQLKLAQHILMREYDPGRGEVKPSLKEFRYWLASLSDAEVHAMAGTPYRITPRNLAKYAAAPQPSEEHVSFMREPSEPPGISEPSMESQASVNESALEYLNRLATPRQAFQKAATAAPPTWRTYRFGNGLEIRCRLALTPEQVRQVELAGQLLQSALEHGTP